MRRLPSKPRLVARSNFATPWSQKRRDGCVVRRVISVIGEQPIVHDILDKFNPDKIMYKVACQKYRQNTPSRWSLYLQVIHRSQIDCFGQP